MKFGTTDDITLFTYTQLGELLTVEDPLNQTTSYTYDLAGRSLTENHPDRGLVINTYDKASNLISMERGSLGPIAFAYSYNRLTSRTMPGSSGNDLYDVVYTYGTPGDGKNGAGRIVTIDQGQGFKVDNFTYDELGQRSSEFATVQVPQVGTRTYGTQFVYSSFGRILQATYPGGDIVDYTYTNKGELYSIESTAPGDPSIYIVQETQYNGFGQIGKLKYGNGTETTYNYASSAFTGLSLDYLNKSSLYASSVDGKATQGGSMTTLVDRDYQYSNLGMVSSLSKGVHASLAAGVTALDYSFSYDDKGRLSGSTLATGGSNIYEMTMGYNAAGGITSKDSDRPGGHPLVDPNLDYELSYTYNPSKPHQLLSVSDAGPNGGLTNFTYDGVGNLINMSGPSGTEELIWNELQQLSGVKNGSGIHHYVYDHSGERIMKSSINRSSVQVNDQTIDDIQYLEPYTLYVNPYFVVTSFQNGDRASKHYYMNTQRVATDISINYQGPPPPAAPGAQGTHNGTQAAPIGLSTSLEQDINQVLHQFGAGEISGALSEDGIAIETYYPKAATESESTNRILYWYHPDYLGSVDLVTDRNGVAYEFFLYTPWGEDMYHYNAGQSSFTSPYRFNGKEKDPETGYHYYGARYYQSKFSVWMSVDPLASEYPSYTPYNFVMNNPISLTDPNGMWVEDADGNLVAEEGDNAYTLADYLNTSAEIAINYLADQGHEVNREGILQLNVGDILKVTHETSAPMWRTDLSGLGNTIRDQIDSEYAKDLFENYWTGGGDLEMDSKQFVGMLLYIKKNSGEDGFWMSGMKDATLVGGSGSEYKGGVRVANFDNSDDYNLALGRASILYNKESRILGFTDDYDFDSKPIGTRTYKNEAITRAVRYASPSSATPFTNYANYRLKKND